MDTALSFSLRRLFTFSLRGFSVPASLLFGVVVGFIVSLDAPPSSFMDEVLQLSIGLLQVISVFLAFGGVYVLLGYFFYPPPTSPTRLWKFFEGHWQMIREAAQILFSLYVSASLTYLAISFFSRM